MSVKKIENIPITVRKVNKESFGVTIPKHFTERFDLIEGLTGTMTLELEDKIVSYKCGSCKYEFTLSYDESAYCPCCSEEHNIIPYDSLKEFIKNEEGDVLE